MIFTEYIIRMLKALKALDTFGIIVKDQSSHLVYPDIMHE